MGKTPQSFEKRQRERAKQRKREEKMERRLARNAEKRQLKEEHGVLEPEIVDREDIVGFDPATPEHKPWQKGEGEDEGKGKGRER